MNPNRSKRFLFFLSLLVIPLLILGGLSFKSIRESAFVIERQYFDQLDQVSDGILAQNQKTAKYLFSQTSLLALNKVQLGSSLTRLSRSAIQEPIPGLDGIVVLDTQHVIYPNIKLSPPTEPQDISTPFEDSLVQFQHRTDLRPRHLALRFRKNSQFKVGTIDHRLNLLGIAKLQFQEKQFQLAIKTITRLQRLYPTRSPQLDLSLLKLKSLIGLKKYAQAYQIAFQLFGQIFEKKRSYDLPQAYFVLNEMYSQLLSDQNLKEEDRKNLWTLNENLKQIFQDAIVYQQSSAIMNSLLEDLKHTGANEFSWKDPNYYYLAQKIELENNTYYALSRWNLKQLTQWYLDDLNLKRPAWRQESFQIIQSNISIGDFSKKANNILYRELPIPHTPIDAIHIYQPQDRELAEMIQNRSWFLYGILIMSFILIILGVVFVIRSFRKEQNLLAMKSNFLSSITHELKTPLTSIKMFSEMMYHGRIKTPEKTQEYGSLIHKETHRLQLMVDDILNYSKMEQGKDQVTLNEMNLIDLIQGIHHRLQPILDQKKMVLTIDAPEQACIWGDYTKLESLFQNLIDNAIKYSKEGSQILVLIQDDGTHISTQVIDQGIGIAKNELASIFDLFYRIGDEMTRKTKGSGLGLAIAQSIAIGHSTKIHVQSELNKGSNFSIKLKKVLHV